MAYRGKIYVAFDADSDIRYYQLMKAWKQNDNTNFDFDNAHDVNNIRQPSSGWEGTSEEQIKRKLRERFEHTNIFILLVGERTKYLYRFVRWEIEQAIERGLPIIVVNLNGKRMLDDNLCPSILKDKLAIHISFNASIIQKAIEQWPTYIKSYPDASGHFRFEDDTYKQLGL